MRQRLADMAAVWVLWSAAIVNGASAGSATPETGGLVLAALTRLPPPPQPAEADICVHLKIQPQTAGGRLATALGWAVTGEVSLDGMDVVSFVGGFVSGTSGSCQMTDGNVGLFDDDQLHWLVYGQEASTVRIGTVETFEKTAIRIWRDWYLPVGGRFWTSCPANRWTSGWTN